MGNCFSSKKKKPTPDEFAYSDEPLSVDPESMPRLARDNSLRKSCFNSPYSRKEIVDKTAFLGAEGITIYGALDEEPEIVVKTAGSRRGSRGSKRSKKSVKLERVQSTKL